MEKAPETPSVDEQIDLLAVSRREKEEARRTGGQSISGSPSALPSWKFTRGSVTYNVGSLSLRLRPLARAQLSELNRDIGPSETMNRFHSLLSTRLTAFPIGATIFVRTIVSWGSVLAIFVPLRSSP